MSWLIGVIIVLFVAVGFAMVFGFNKLHHASLQLNRLNQQVDSLQASVHALSSGARGLSDKTAICETRLNRVSARLESIDREVPSTQLYGRAIGLASHGTTAEEIVDATGVTLGEAELLVKYRQSLKSKAG